MTTAHVRPSAVTRLLSAAAVAIFCAAAADIPPAAACEDLRAVLMDHIGPSDKPWPQVLIVHDGDACRAAGLARARADTGAIVAALPAAAIDDLLRLVRESGLSQSEASRWTSEYGAMRALIIENGAESSLQLTPSDGERALELILARLPRSEDAVRARLQVLAKSAPPPDRTR